MQLVLPADEVLRGPVAIRPLDRGRAVHGHLLEQLLDDASRRVVGVDENCKPRSLAYRHDPPPTGSKGNALLAARSGVSGRQELALKPAFDLVWQAAGFAGSRNYNAAAQWAPRRD
jgi:hypothetical protein